MFGRKKDVGAAGELAARRFLQRGGYRILDRNWRCPHGELDLVALCGEMVVFVEVKTRRSRDAADPEVNIGPAKQRKLLSVARAWLNKHGYPDRAYRFDSVSVVLGDAGAPEIRHIEEAFVPAG
jgi:putative endonuclease